jgi:hypothetical protein
MYNVLAPTADSHVRNFCATNSGPGLVKSWVMGKRKTKKQSDKATLAEVVKQMAKPRVATSARE